jgi:hypothetical protein
MTATFAAEGKIDALQATDWDAGGGCSLSATHPSSIAQRKTDRE